MTAELIPFPISASTLESEPDLEGRLVSIVAITETWLEQTHTLDELTEAKAQLAGILGYVRERDELAHRGKEIKALMIRTERQIGLFLDQIPRNSGARKPRSSGAHPGYAPESEAPTLADQGLTQREATRARKLARIPDDDFEAAVEEGQSNGHISSAQVIRATSPEPEADKLSNLKPSVRMVEGHAVCNDFDLGPEVVLRGAIRLADKAEQKLGDWLRKLVAQTVADSAGRTVKKP